MDPLSLQSSGLGGYGFGGGFSGTGVAPAPAQGISSTTMIVIGVSVCLLVVVGSLFMLGGGGSGGGGSVIPAIIGNGANERAPVTTKQPSATPVNSVREEPIPTTEPDSKLATFAFEPYGGAGKVPGKDGRLVRKPAGNPPYKFVQCGTSGYAIRWMGKYLTLYSSSKMEWTEDKQEPHSCFVTMPGYCGSDDYVMLRSMANKMFLRAEDTGVLVCKDTPTARNAKQFCWKLRPDVEAVQPCGCQYSYDLQRVVCTPCDVKKMPDAGKSCETVTPGYRADCCISKGQASLNDTFCKAAAWPEVVGRNIKEVMLYLRTKRPDLTLRPCPAPCTVSGYPTPMPNVIVIPYDPRSSLVTAPARVLI